MFHVVIGGLHADSTNLIKSLKNLKKFVFVFDSIIRNSLESSREIMQTREQKNQQKKKTKTKIKNPKKTQKKQKTPLHRVWSNG